MVHSKEKYGLMAQLVRAPPCHGGGRGFESRLGRSGSLAQLGEHLPYKQRVTGSSPVTSIGFTESKAVNAGVAELADAQDLKSCCSDTVPVRFRSPAFPEKVLDKGAIIIGKTDIDQPKEYVCVAQLDRALGYGPRCREFESSRARMSGTVYTVPVFLSYNEQVRGKNSLTRKTGQIL